MKAEVLLDTCSELHLTQLIKDPTRITPQTTSLLDIIMISSSSKVKRSGIRDIGISDHCMIYCILKLRDWSLITGGAGAKWGGSKIFVEWKRGGQIILCEQKEKY